jgi:hypothetical protein
MSLVADTLALFLALVLGTSALHKVRQPTRLGAAAANLAGVSDADGMTLARLAAAVESLAALALVIPTTRVGGAGIALVLWSTYALLVWRAAARGAAFDCGCTLVRPKPGRDRLSPLSPLILALCAAGLAVLPVQGPIQLQAAFAAAALVCLRFAAEEIAAAAQFNKGAHRA